MGVQVSYPVKCSTPGAYAYVVRLEGQGTSAPLIAAGGENVSTVARIGVGVYDVRLNTNPGEFLGLSIGRSSTGVDVGTTVNYSSTDREFQVDCQGSDFSASQFLTIVAWFKRGV